MHGPGNRPYRLTNDDLLWLARATEGESSSREGRQAVIWAIAQNHMLRGPNPPRISSFAELIRRYCQPVNPRWDDPSDQKCIEHPARCTPAHIARRRRIASMRWGEIDPEVRELVTLFSRGQLENTVPEMVDWAAFDYPGWMTRIGSNRFGTKVGQRLV